MNLINDRTVTVTITEDDDRVTIRLTNNWKTKLMIGAVMALFIMMTLTAIYNWAERTRGLPRCSNGPIQTPCDPEDQECKVYLTNK